jgi:hypothetical protein
MFTLNPINIKLNDIAPINLIFENFDESKESKGIENANKCWRRGNKKMV